MVSTTNIIKNNTVSGNDIGYLDGGTASIIEYICYSASDIQEAIDSIGAKAGTIKLLSQTYTITATLTFDGGGDYIMEGEGNTSIISMSTSNIEVISVTSASSCTLKNFKVVQNNLPNDATIVYGIEIDEGSDNQVIIDNVTVSTDDNTITDKRGIGALSNNIVIQNCYCYNYYYGIALESQYSIASNCRLNSCYQGILIDTDNCIVSNNIIDDFVQAGIKIGFVTSADTDYNVIEGNVIDGGGSGNMGIVAYKCNSSVISYNTITGIDYHGIQLLEATFCNINGNNISDNTMSQAVNTAGIFLDENNDDNIITGNMIQNNTNGGAGDGYGILINNANNDRNYFANNKIYNNDVSIGDIGTGTIGLIKKLPFLDWEVDTFVNCTATKVYDTTKRQIVMDIDATGATASCVMWCEYRIPDDFQGFFNVSSDLTVSAISDAGADRDSTLTIDFYDDSGTDSDDDSVSATTIANSYTNYDCAINAGTFQIGDKVIVKLSIALPDADDGVRISKPIINYY